MFLSFLNCLVVPFVLFYHWLNLFEVNWKECLHGVHPHIDGGLLACPTG